MRAPIDSADGPRPALRSGEVKTLPDYLRPELDIAFVGINPGKRSAEAGRYFASPRNRFWPALNRSGLLREELSPETDERVLDFGIGLTDLVKRPTSGVSDLSVSDFREAVPLLRGKIERFRPTIVCFLSVLACRNYAKYAHAQRTNVKLGLQSWQIGDSRVFLTPSPSPANAVYSLDDITGWFIRVKQLSDDLKKARG